MCVRVADVAELDCLPEAGFGFVASGACSGVTCLLGFALDPAGPGVPSIPRNWLTAVWISPEVAVTYDGPRVPLKWISLICAPRRSKNSLSTCSICSAELMSEDV